MAVPFVGKDVPSRSSEFAHPDVLIGLTIMAYRYEGLRGDPVGRHRADVDRVVTQLKNDFSREIGSSSERPAAIQFESWKKLGYLSMEGKEDMNVLPLAEFQPGDKDQLARVAKLIGHLPEVIHYYLEEHIFPDTMNFQSLKISACGHELGGGILFGERIGFSGTPSYLLPMELGECLPEPGSDGRIMDTLTDPKIVTYAIQQRWSAKKLLNDIASDTNPHGPFHALIDTGALVTGMDNLEVAEYLLSKLNDSYQGVVYLDRHDQKMILLRSSHQSVKLSQSGIPWKNRFSFYDQVHTTGMDIKQFPNARAVVTVGKDMTFRDYAQGSFRMRGLDSGHTLHLYIIPEVAHRIREELGPLGLIPSDGSQPQWQLLVPAWLLTNSMRMESLQYMQLLVQELHNVWRTSALNMLLNNSESNANRSAEFRLKRFVGQGHQKEMLCGAVQQFREEVNYVIPEDVPEAQKFSEVVNDLVTEHASFVEGPEDLAKVEHIQAVASAITLTSESTNISSKDSEREQQQEKEQEQEKEKEKEREKEREGEFTRDDEQHNLWFADKLIKQAVPGGEAGKDFCDWVLTEPFYPFHAFKARSYDPSLPFPGCLLLSDNYFRPRWSGLRQDRRLKNIGLVLEWIPDVVQDPNERYLVAVSLFEGESIRHIIHNSALNEQPKGNAAPKRVALGNTALALRSTHGLISDRTDNFVEEQPGGQIDAAMQCLRFFDGQMYFDKEALEVLSRALVAAPLDARRNFFDSSILLRRRERTMWSDTPVAKLFTEESQWDDLRPAALIEALRTKLISDRKNAREAFDSFDKDQDGYLTKAELRAAFSSLHLGFSAGDISTIIQKADQVGAKDNRIDYDEFCKVFAIPEPKSLLDNITLEEQLPWYCENFTCGGNFPNPPGSLYCLRCDSPNPAFPFLIPVDNHPGMWQCPQCTLLNPDRLNYCKLDGCNAARPW